MNPYVEVNRRTWNTWTTQETQSDHHKDMQRYRATGSSLRSIDLAELGEVTGKTLLHLQCNMGSDSLSWARRGALVTGMDVSEAAIAQARELAVQTQTTARFIAADVYALPGLLADSFDIVFSSYGVLCWLPDLTRWAQIVASGVKPGGLFYLVDSTPSPIALRLPLHLICASPLYILIPIRLNHCKCWRGSPILLFAPGPIVWEKWLPRCSRQGWS